MKLRIRRNSIRLRLTISEVERLGAGGAVTATLDLTPAIFAFELRADRVDNITASFDRGRFTVLVPFEDAKELARSERVGLRPSGSCPAQILIEKDFGCAKQRPGEDVTDLFGYNAVLY